MESSCVWSSTLSNAPSRTSSCNTSAAVTSARLVPVELVESATERELRLRCTREKFQRLEAAKETEFLPGEADQFAYSPYQVTLRPYFAVSSMRVASQKPQKFTHDKVPHGEVEVRRGQSVHASDGPIGRVRGLGVDPGDYQVTHVLLDEGHLWGEKEVCIPITAVTGVDVIDGVSLSLSKAQVAERPPVEVHKRG